jgi:N-acetylglucosamine kinase-like BadF-type ATPase
MNYYIGLDAHSASCTAVVVNEKGDILFRQEFKTTEANLVGFLRQLPVGKKHLTFELPNFHH